MNTVSITGRECRFSLKVRCDIRRISGYIVVEIRGVPCECIRFYKYFVKKKIKKKKSCKQTYDNIFS